MSGTNNGTAKKDITISGVLDCLDNGMSREEIRNHYSLEAWELKELFQHPKLKGRKAKVIKEVSFNLIDDTEETADTPSEQEAGVLQEEEGAMA